jgi:hypothetical protein
MDHINNITYSVLCRTLHRAAAPSSPTASLDGRTLQDERHQGFDLGREVLELGLIPPPGGAAPAGEVRSGARGHGERVHRLRDHGEAEEPDDLEEVVRARDELEQAAPGDPVPLVTAAAAAASQPREEVVVVQVAGDADGEDEDAGVEQVDGGVREVPAEVQSVDHVHRGDEQVAGGNGRRRGEWHVPAVAVDEQDLAGGNIFKHVAAPHGTWIANASLSQVLQRTPRNLGARGGV